MDIVCAMKQRECSRSSVIERASQRIFFGVSALLFIASAVLTIRWCTSMSMGEMPMPGGWTMSMTWIRMCGQTWLDAAASFLGMWVTMMVAMMLPSLTPVLWRYYQAVSQPNSKLSSLSLRERVGVRALCTQHIPLTRATRDLSHEGRGKSSRLTLILIVGLGYFLVWTLIGITAFPIGVSLATIAMQSPTLASVVPIVAGVVVLIAGALQFTAWKADRLACCREAPRCHLLPANAVAAWRYGMRLGVHCSCCCAGLTVILLVVGVMDLRAMTVVTAAITVERLAPAGERVARIIGVVVVATGLLMLARVATLV